MATNNNVASGIQHWSIAGGRLLKEVQFPEQLRILRQTMPMSRLVPVMRVSQQGQATLLDLENGTTLGWFAAGGNVHQGNCHILSDIVVLPITNQIVGAYRISTLAPDAQQNKPIWTVNLPTNTYIHQINPLGDKALVIYYNGGMTVVDATSGKELWNLTTPDRNGSFSQIHGNADKVIIMRTLHRPGQFTRFVSINDSSTGKELFRFEGDQQTYVTVAMLPGHPGMFVTRNHRDLEYWIHDPAGPITFDAEAVARKEAEARRKAAEENTNQRNQ